jgi:hypothetical protein
VSVVLIGYIRTSISGVGRWATKDLRRRRGLKDIGVWESISSYNEPRRRNGASL